MRFEAAVWRSRGWATLNVSYRACAQSLQDVFWYYDHLRTTKGAGAVICAAGASAGGHLAMMVAGIYPDLDCAISQAGPLWLDELHHQAAYNGNTAWPEWVSGLAQGAFGLPPALTFSSPHAWVNNIGDTRMLIATAQNDVLIPLAQGRDYGASVLAYNPGNYVQVFEAPDGVGASFVHGTTTLAGAIAYRAAEDALVAPLV
jgi:acetyl esterase/lipase